MHLALKRRASGDRDLAERERGVRHRSLLAGRETSPNQWRGCPARSCLRGNTLLEGRHQIHVAQRARLLLQHEPLVVATLRDVGGSRHRPRSPARRQRPSPNEVSSRLRPPRSVPRSSSRSSRSESSSLASGGAARRRPRGDVGCRVVVAHVLREALVGVRAGALRGGVVKMERPSSSQVIELGVEQPHLCASADGAVGACLPVRAQGSRPSARRHARGLQTWRGSPRHRRPRARRRASPACAPTRAPWWSGAGWETSCRGQPRAARD